MLYIAEHAEGIVGIELEIGPPHIEQSCNQLHVLRQRPAHPRLDLPGAQRGQGEVGIGGKGWRGAAFLEAAGGGGIDRDAIDRSECGRGVPQDRAALVGGWRKPGRTHLLAVASLLHAEVDFAEALPLHRIAERAGLLPDLVAGQRAEGDSGLDHRIGHADGAWADAAKGKAAEIIVNPPEPCGSKQAVAARAFGKVALDQQFARVGLRQLIAAQQHLPLGAAVFLRAGEEVSPELVNGEARGEQPQPDPPAPAVDLRHAADVLRMARPVGPVLPEEPVARDAFGKLSAMPISVQRARLSSQLQAGKAAHRKHHEPRSNHCESRNCAPWRGARV